MRKDAFKRMIKFKKKRFCLTCEKITLFKFKEKINHSLCIKCKGWKARRIYENDKK